MYVSVCQKLYVLYACVCIPVSVCLSVMQSICSYVYLSMRPSSFVRARVCVCVQAFVPPSICQSISVHPSVCLLACVSVCPFVCFSLTVVSEDEVVSAVDLAWFKNDLETVSNGSVHV